MTHPQYESKSETVDNATPGQRPRVWLHIGMPKTGSTALQTALFHNRRSLRSEGFFYPDFGDRQHIGMARMLARRAGSKIPFPKAGVCPDVPRLIDYCQAEAPDCHTVILSTENLFQRPGGAPRVKLVSLEESLQTIGKTAECTRDYLADMDVDIVVWLRRQDNWLMSMYNETVKRSMYREDFWEFANSTVGAQLHAIVSIWVDLFGRERVHCFSYDSVINQRRDIVQEFANLVGFDPAILSADRDNAQKRRNAGLSLEALQLKLIINQQCAELPPAARKTINKGSFRKLVLSVTNQSAEWPHAMLSPSERLELMSIFAEGNRKLVADLGYAEVADLTDNSDLEKLQASGSWRAWPDANNDTLIRELISCCVEHHVQPREPKTRRKRANRPSS